MNINPLLRKAFAEFLGVAFFLTAINGAVAAAQPLKIASLATVLGLAIFATASISGGHLNPAVSIYFWSRKQISNQEFGAYIVAQLLGAILGTCVGLALWGKSLSFASSSDMGHGQSTSWMLGELVATGGLVWLVGRLASTGKGNAIPFAVGLWVMAAANFTQSGAEANPAVAFGLLFAGHATLETAVGILMQLLGMLIASIFVTIFAEKKVVEAPAAKVAVAAKTATRKPAAKKPAAKKPAARKTTK